MALPGLQRNSPPRALIWVAALLNLVSYVDRSCISVAAPLIGHELRLSPTQLGAMFSSFFLSYALLQAPWGMLADRLGPRRIVATAVAAWCTFTALTGAAGNYVSLLIVRFAFGATESALGPSISSAFGLWIPDANRTTAFGIFLAGGRIGGALAPIIAAFLVARYGWRVSFVVLALAGVAMPFLWLRAVPSAIAPAREKEQSARKALLSERFVALMLVVFGYTVMWQFFSTWYPTYLVERRGYTLAEAARYESVPFLLGIASNWLGGFVCDALCRRWGVPLGRGFLGCISLVSSGALFYFGIVSANRAAPWMFAAAAGAGDIILPLAWNAAADLGGKSAGAFGGLMNSASNLGAFISPLLLGAAIERWKNWDEVLIIGAASTFAAALLWIPVHWPAHRDPTRNSVTAK
jgi:MFS transporter, ACS family, glucarate transporter